ncbi:MAG: RelA/SpoT domain-containing protein, partial [Bacteroidia bacterium]|nr:RelA/SpoT domain-containing protein [Bacteroidia bacterium]
MTTPIEKQMGFIAEFVKVRPDYVDFAKLLETILNKVGEKFGFLALVQARAKTVVSFSNKIIMKDKYRNPLTDMTDLCGARVIVHFQSHVEKVCSFIKENFEVDEANSLDLKSRLKVSEFGYRSIHYIITPKKDNILGVLIAEKFKTMKAEVQVRTLAEHVWADISHDRIYKTCLNIPEEWKREAARLSAILENADIIFAKMAFDIDSVSVVYELQYETEKAKTEIEKLNTLIAVQENDPDECVKNLLKLSAIYRAMDKFTEAGAELKSWLGKPLKNPVLSGKLLFEYGVVLALSSGNDTSANNYAEGMKVIKQSLELFDNLADDVQKNNQLELSYIHYRLGRLLQRNEEESRQQADHFSLAYSIMPENPLYLVALMESLVLRNIDIARYNISLFKANIGEAIPKLKELIDIGIKRVPAWFAIGHCYLMLGDEVGCIMAYSRAVETILNNSFLTSHATIAAEITLIGKFKALNPKLSEQIKLYLNIAMVLVADSSNKGRYKNYLENHKIRKEPFKTPVVIVAGGASLMDDSKIDYYRDYIREMMYDFKGTIISGGTTAGIPGLVGQVKDEIQKQAPVEFDLMAYLPEKLPDDAVKSMVYNRFYKTDSDKFSA